MVWTVGYYKFSAQGSIMDPSNPLEWEVVASDEIFCENKLEIFEEKIKEPGE